MKTFVKAMLLCAAFCPFFSCSPDDGTGENTGELPNVNYASEEGLYFGIVGFNNDAYLKKIGLLNSTTAHDYTSFIDNLPQKEKTALYYSVKTAIDELKNAILPETLENVSIITFTDGLDNHSTGIIQEKSGVYIENEEYFSQVSQELKNTSIRDKAVTAYAVGFLGEANVTNKKEEEFTNSLKSLATSDDNVHKVSNINEVSEVFANIAKNLNQKTNFQVLTLSIPGGINNGTKIRFTFDEVEGNDISSSKVYIELDLYRSDFTFKNLECSEGLKINEEDVYFRMENGGLLITFNIETDYDIQNNKDLIKFSKYLLDEGQWEVDPEFSPEAIPDVKIDRKSAAIILVLDCSNSLGKDGFKQIQTTAKDFINILVSGESGTSGDDNNSGNNNNNGNTSDARRVDLGLSVCWASCNVGANEPWENGNYYAWGETYIKEAYSNDTYEHYTYWGEVSGGYDFIGLDISETEYDVAHVEWGGDWRIPTSLEMTELYNRCTWTRTSVNGRDGYEVTGPNGNSIFLPSAGYCNGWELEGYDTKGLYWDSEGYDDYRDYLGDALGWDNDDRWRGGRYRTLGGTVRPVTE